MEVFKASLLLVAWVGAADTQSSFEEEMSNKGTIDPDLDYNCNEANQNSCYYTDGVWDHYRCICLYP